MQNILNIIELQLMNFYTAPSKDRDYKTGLVHSLAVPET
jgi:hypothetical protein